MAEEVNLEQLHYLHPKLRPYVEVLLRHEFGLLRNLPSIQGIQCGSIVEKNRYLHGDRFQLRIIYCRRPLIWQVLMNGNDLSKAPDFIMEDNFLAGATSDTIKSKVPSLANWCPRDVKCLLNVVLELLELYKNYQVLEEMDLPINILRENAGLQRYLFEYETLIAMAKIDPDDIEVCVQPAIRTVVVTFLIHLKMDFSKLPTALPDTKDLIILDVEFKDNAKSTVQVMQRLELEDAFGGPLELPDLSPDMSLMDYIPALEKILQEKIETVIQDTHNRKMLYSYLVQFFEPALINGDNKNFMNVSFLLEDSMFCVLNVHIPIDYPKTRPSLQLLSLHTNSSRSSNYNSFRYNQNMNHEEVARSIFTYVKKTAINELRKTLT